MMTMSHPKKKFTKVYVDGDLLLYEVSSATQKNVYDIYIDGTLAYTSSDKRKINEMFKGIDYGFERWVITQPIMAAIDTYKKILKGYEAMFGTRRIEVVLTGTGNFREKIAVSREYKGTRSKEKPNNFYKLREYMIKHGAIEVDGEEADDYLSYNTYMKYDTVAVTSDKDALNTPSYIYNTRKEELIYVSKEDADKNFWTQVITGDSVDCIPGLPNVGKVGANQLLEECETYQECERAVGLAYACHPAIDDPEAYLTEQATLLWMRRKPEEEWHIGLN